MEMFTATTALKGLTDPCPTPGALFSWASLYCKIKIPTVSVCPHHQAPFEYLRSAYFEPATDVVVWAPRGGGKTRLAAMATLLDLLHKRNTSVRILGGSLDQSLRTWEHLLPDVFSLAKELIVGNPTGRTLKLINGSACAVLPQSQRAVRGLRVQKLRCDEVELFDPAIWEAAQMVTRSRDGVHGSIDAISTFHKPWGLMAKVVDKARAEGKRVLQWCLLDVMQRCPPDRACRVCPLWDDCRGIAKTRCDGFVSIDDAIRMKQRVSLETWEAEMLCRRPVTLGRVFPTFDERLHVTPRRPTDGFSTGVQLAMDFGFANAFACLWIDRSDTGVIYIIDEYIQPGRTMDQHLEVIEHRPWPKARRICCDPAGSGPNDQTAISNVQLLRARGYAVRYRASRIADGLELIRRALKPATGPVTLFIHPRCVKLRLALAGYHYAEGQGEIPEKDGQFDHPIDALRYFFVNNTAGRVITRRY